MKRNATRKNTIKTFITNTGRVLVLSMICMLIPGCINNAGSSMQNAPSMAMQGAGTRAIIIEKGNQAEKTEVADQKNITKKSTRQVNSTSQKSTAKGITQPDNTPADIEHTDVHDANEEEKVLNITFPALMRVAIMMLFVILII